VQARLTSTLTLACVLLALVLCALCCVAPQEQQAALKQLKERGLPGGCGLAGTVKQQLLNAAAQRRAELVYEVEANQSAFWAMDDAHRDAWYQVRRTLS